MLGDCFEISILNLIVDNYIGYSRLSVHINIRCRFCGNKGERTIEVDNNTHIVMGCTQCKFQERFHIQHLLHEYLSDLAVRSFKYGVLWDKICKNIVYGYKGCFL